MLKTLAFTAALVCGTAAVASAKTLTPPAPPSVRYQLPNATGAYPADRLPEGRSIYQMPAPGEFWGADEQGYPTGREPNPQIGG
ncbi:MAG: hypothetical protein L0Y50_07800 [Beijerinckiaceae bacterium]|nr:hypothetical protein [Beijerinckiaceae bacterium]MCI0736160.1 hypothetical protein [Beijerinckiaceae bacterium]